MGVRRVPLGCDGSQGRSDAPPNVPRLRRAGAGAVSFFTRMGHDETTSCVDFFECRNPKSGRCSSGRHLTLGAVCFRSASAELVRTNHPRKRTSHASWFCSDMPRWTWASCQGATPQRKWGALSAADIRCPVVSAPPPNAVRSLLPLALAARSYRLLLSRCCGFRPWSGVRRIARSRRRRRFRDEAEALAARAALVSRSGCRHSQLGHRCAGRRPERCLVGPQDMGSPES